MLQGNFCPALCRIATIGAGGLHSCVATLTRRVFLPFEAIWRNYQRNSIGPCLAPALGMRRSALWFWFLVVPLSGCMTTVQRVETVSDGTRTVMKGPDSGTSAVEAELRYDHGIIRGQLSWANRCHRAVEELSHEDVIEERKPNHGHAVGALFVGSLAAAGSIALLSNRKSFSDVETCSTDSDGHDSCSSPRSNATAVGVIGFLGSLLLAGGAIGTFGAKTTSRTVDELPLPPRLVRSDKAVVPCGEGSIANLNLALQFGQERLSSTVSTAEGQFALIVPERTSGILSVIVEAVPPELDMIRPFAVVGSIELPAVSEVESAGSGDARAEPRAM